MAKSYRAYEVWITVNEYGRKRTYLSGEYESKTAARRGMAEEIRHAKEVAKRQGLPTGRAGFHWAGKIKAGKSRVKLSDDFDPMRVNPSKRATRKRVSRSLTKYVRNFTGTITRTQDGQVVIAGTGPLPKTAKNPLLPQGGLKRIAAEYKRHRAAGEGVGRSVKRAVRTARSNKKRKR